MLTLNLWKMSRIRDRYLEAQRLRNLKRLKKEKKKQREKEKLKLKKLEEKRNQIKASMITCSTF